MPRFDGARDSRRVFLCRWEMIGWSEEYKDRGRDKHRNGEGDVAVMVVWDCFDFFYFLSS